MRNAGRYLCVSVAKLCIEIKSATLPTVGSCERSAFTRYLRNTQKAPLLSVSRASAVYAFFLTLTATTTPLGIDLGVKCDPKLEKIDRLRAVD